MILVIGIGTPAHGDDAAGLLVAERVRAVTSPRDVTVRELVGDQLALLDAWNGARDVYLVDAVVSGAPPGTLYRFDAAERLATRFMNRGTHTFSVADVIELARLLDRLPRRLIGYGIEAASFELGAPVSPEVMTAVEEVAHLLVLDLQVGT